MNDPEDIRKAWSYIEAYKLPAALTASERSEWQIIVEMMSKEDFDRARGLSRTRPGDRLRFRPSTEEFWGYLEAEKPADTPRPENGPKSEWRGHDYGTTSPSALQYGLDYIAKIREAQGWKTPDNSPNAPMEPAPTDQPKETTHV